MGDPDQVVVGGERGRGAVDASAPSRGLFLQRAVIALRGTVRGDHPGSLVEGPVSDPLGGDRRRRGEDDQRGGADEGANHFSSSIRGETLPGSTTNFCTYDTAAAFTAALSRVSLQS